MELVLVILLLGILSSVAVGRFADRQSYDRRAIQQHWLSVLRQARQIALSRADMGGVTLTISSASDDWLSQLDSSSGDSLNSRFARRGLSVHLGEVGSQACGLLTSGTLSLTFDGNGQLLPFEDRRLCINADPSIEICISASGHPVAGTCP